MGCLHREGVSIASVLQACGRLTTLCSCLSARAPAAALGGACLKPAVDRVTAATCQLIADSSALQQQHMADLEKSIQRLAACITVRQMQCQMGHSSLYGQASQVAAEVVLLQAACKCLRDRQQQAGSGNLSSSSKSKGAVAGALPAVLHDIRMLLGELWLGAWRLENSTRFLCSGAATHQCCEDTMLQMAACM